MNPVSLVVHTRERLSRRCEVETITFVIEFEDGKAPPVNAHMEAFGGKVVAVAFRDALAEDDEEEGDDDA